MDSLPEIGPSSTHCHLIQDGRGSTCCVRANGGFGAEAQLSPLGTFQKVWLQGKTVPDRGRPQLRPDALAPVVSRIRRGADSRRWLRPPQSYAPRAGARAADRFAAGRRAALPCPLA